MQNPSTNGLGSVGSYILIKILAVDFKNLIAELILGSASIESKLLTLTPSGPQVPFHTSI